MKRHEVGGKNTLMAMPRPDPVVRLIEIPHGKRSRHGPHVVATANFYPLISPILHNMATELYVRNTFNIELKVDILSTDDERQKAFVELMTNTARMLYGQAAMLSKKTPSLTVTSIGSDGKTSHDIFEGSAFANSEE